MNAWGIGVKNIADVGSLLRLLMLKKIIAISYKQETRNVSKVR